MYVNQSIVGAHTHNIKYCRRVNITDLCGQSESTLHSFKNQIVLFQSESFHGLFRLSLILNSYFCRFCVFRGSLFA